MKRQLSQREERAMEKKRRWKEKQERRKKQEQGKEKRPMRGMITALLHVWRDPGGRGNEEGS